MAAEHGSRRRSKKESLLDEPPDLDEEGVPKDRPRGITSRILNGVLSYGVIVLIFAFLFNKLGSADDMGASLELITASQVVICCLLGLFNLFTNLPPIVTTLPGLRYREAGVTNFASAAVSNTVPEGGAVATGMQFAMMRSWGFRLNAITSSFLTTGIWTNLVRYGLMAIALVALSYQEDSSETLRVIALVVTVLIALAIGALIGVLRSAPFARWLGRLIGKVTAPAYRLARKAPLDDWDDRTEEFRDELLVLVQRRWLRLTLTMMLSQLSACLVLGVALRLQGLDASLIPVSLVIVAYASMALASLVAPTPGGLGVAEVTLLAVLTYNLPAEYDNAVIASILLFRMATWLLPIPVGAGCYLFWRSNHSWRLSQDERDARTAASADPTLAPTS